MSSYAGLSAEEAKEQSVLKSKAGCLTCRQRKKRCDFTKPNCKTCLRLGLQCEWLPARMSLPSAVRAGLAKNSINRTIPLELSHKLLQQASETDASAISMGIHPDYIRLAPHHLEFDDPSILRGSATSIFEKPIDKQFHQYLFERGHILLNFGVPKLPGLENFNIINHGFAIFREDRLVLRAGHAAAAAQLTQRHPDLFPLAMNYYQACIRGLVQRINDECGIPSSATCSTASWLLTFEQSVPSNPNVGLQHFLGFQNLVTLRLRSSEPLGTAVTIIEMYVWRFLVYSTFRSEQTAKTKNIEYVDDIFNILNQSSRPFGRSILGIPDELVSLAYKLNILRTKDRGKSPWAERFSVVRDSLGAWQPSPIHYLPAFKIRYTIAKLYHLACCVYYEKLLDCQNDSLPFPRRLAAVEEAVNILDALPPEPGPPLALLWPLAILGLAASNHTQLKFFQDRLKDFVDICGFLGHQTVITLLDTAWGTGTGNQNYFGLDVLLDDKVLEAVHI